MSLDIAAGIMTGMFTMCMVCLFLLSSKNRHNWIPLPGYIRWGCLATGFAFMIRSVNFFSIEGDETVSGHINIWGVVAFIPLTYLGISVVWFLGRKYLPEKSWDRLVYAFKDMNTNPDHVPVMLSKTEVVDITRAYGIPATKPGEGPEALTHEVPRYTAFTKALHG